MDISNTTNQDQILFQVIIVDFLADIGILVK